MKLFKNITVILVMILVVASAHADTLCQRKNNTPKPVNTRVQDLKIVGNGVACPSGYRNIGVLASFADVKQLALGVFTENAASLVNPTPTPSTAVSVRCPFQGIAGTKTYKVGDALPVGATLYGYSMGFDDEGDGNDLRFCCRGGYVIYFDYGGRSFGGQRCDENGRVDTKAQGVTIQ